MTTSHNSDTAGSHRNLMAHGLLFVRLGFYLNQMATLENNTTGGRWLPRFFWRGMAVAIALGIVAIQALLLRSVNLLRSELSLQQQKVDHILALIPALMDAHESADRRAQPSFTAAMRAPLSPAGLSAAAHYHADAEDLREFLASGRAFERMLNRMADEFDRLESVVDMDRAWTTLRATPAMDMRDDGWSYVVLFDMQGVSASDVQVGLDGRLLQVRCAPAGTDQRGRSHLRFDRRIWLPGPVCGAERLNTSFSNGMLKIVVPKQAYAQGASGPAAGRDHTAAGK